MRRTRGENGRHRLGIPYMNDELSAIISTVERDTGDMELAESIYFSPTALTHVKRLLEYGGTIVCDTMLVAGDVNANLLGLTKARVACFIDDPEVISIAEHKRVTRAEVAVDYGLALPGPKLMVVGSAPAAINRMIARRQHEPMSDVCVMAAPSGFASVVQMKERLVDSDLTSIVIRGKKGGITATVSLLNAMLRGILTANNMGGSRL